MSFSLINAVQFVNCIVFNILICLIWSYSFLSFLGSLVAQPHVQNYDIATDVKGKKLKNKREHEENDKMPEDDSTNKTIKRLKSSEEKELLDPECNEGLNLDLVGSSFDLSAIAPETNRHGTYSHSWIKDDICKDLQEVADSGLIIDNSVNDNAAVEDLTGKLSSEANINVLVRSIIAELIDTLPAMQRMQNHKIIDTIIDGQQIHEPLDLCVVTPETNLRVTPSCIKNVICRDLEEVKDAGFVSINNTAIKEATGTITNNEANKDVIVKDIIDELIATVPTMQKRQTYEIIDKIIDRQQIQKQKPKSGKFWKEGKKNKRSMKRRSVSFNKRMKNKEQKVKNKKITDLLLRSKELLEAEVREKRMKGKMKHRLEDSE